jgi:hypothetical protein
VNDERDDDLVVLADNVILHIPPMVFLADTISLNYQDRIAISFCAKDLLYSWVGVFGILLLVFDE